MSRRHRLWPFPAFSCPRCRELHQLERGALTSHSTFLPARRRGRVPVVRVRVHCLKCDYSWWSISDSARALPEAATPTKGD